MTNFENQLLSIIEERQSVLSEIERALFTRRYQLSQKHCNILWVHSITMIYSIWEGFIQQAFQLYIDYLNSLSIDFNRFSDEIITFHMENTFKQLIEYPKNTNKKILYFTQLREHYSKNHHKLYTYINTDSNVSFEMLNKILCTFSLQPFPEHWNKYTYPNPNLKQTLTTFLRYRNSIAHGGDISSEEKVTQEVYEKYKKLVIDLMYEIYNKIICGISSESFKRENNL